jgi:putative nucleotidyltransferase with HDIG domain
MCPGNIIVRQQPGGEKNSIMFENTTFMAEGLDSAFRRGHLMDIIRKHLDKVEVLPMSPILLSKLLPKLSDVDTNFDEVVEIIAFDPALTSKLLQICNSAYFGHKSEVNSVAEAVKQVGYQAVYLLVAMISGSSCFPHPSPPGVDGSKLWRHSITTAFNAKFVAESAVVDSNLLFTAGLLHDLGKVILGQEQVPGAAAIFRAPSDAASLAREEEIFDCTHAEVGAALLERWKLPTQIVIGVRHHHEPTAAPGFQRITACITLANFVTHSQEHPEILERPDFKEVLAYLDLSPDHLERWNERLRDHQNLLASLSHLPV